VNQSRTTFSYSGCLLPLTQLNFTAELNGKAVQLHWATATEINTKNFVVQRSIDAVHFENIGIVKASGNSTRKTFYQFTDAGSLNAGVKKLYYRLQMIDKDGRFTYSKVAIVEILNDKVFVVYPNPAKDHLFIVTSTSLAKQK
jgi:hypothetical protein